MSVTDIARSREYAEQLITTYQETSRYICVEGEYDESGKPTIANPNPNARYFVPAINGTETDKYTEWEYLNGAWEETGSGAASAGASNITVKTTNEWINQPEYLPKKGELVIYSDYQQIVEGGITKNIPSMKVGDGVNPVRLLSFLGTVSSVQQLTHKLTIGSHVFDGTQDINIPVYNGDNQ